MDDLKLPAAKAKRVKDRHLSMDDYFKFVLYNLKHTVDIDFARKLRKMNRIKAQFYI